jgi:predicted GNAT family acetyltransferase
MNAQNEQGITLTNGEFQLVCKGEIARLKTRKQDEGTINFYSTFVPPECRGCGTGARLVCHCLEWARGQGLKVVPGCPYVKTVVKRYPQFRDVLLES